MSVPHLFSKYDVFALVTNSLDERVKKQVDSLNSDQVLKINEDDLVSYIHSKMQLQVPVLRKDAIHYDQQEVQVDARRFANNRMFLNPRQPYYVPGVRVRVRIPFEGESDLFHVAPSFWRSSGRPVGEIVNHEIVLTYEQEKPDGEAIKNNYLAAVTDIEEHLASLENSFDGFNRQIQPIIRAQIKRRRDTLISAASVGDALGLPNRSSGKSSVTYTIDLKKRERPTINLPSKTATAKPEPVLSQTDYEYVIRIMRLMSETMEKAPKSFATMGEEAIRDNFLVHINAQYEGMASGEAFNFAGKTDILLRVEGSCVFIGECKFWTGEKGLLETIDQVLSYLSWRDTKVAVVILNRNKQFTRVLRTIEAIVPLHKCFVKAIGIEGETTFRYEFHQPNDEQRMLQLTVLVFDVPRDK